MNNRNRVRLSKLSLGLALALAAAPAFAQNTTAALGGRVTGSDGSAVVGATVTIVHEASGTSSAAVTGPDGRYSARNLRVGGPYTITITKDGVTEKREGVFLALAETAAVDAQLGAGPTTLGTVEVTGTAITAEVFSADKIGTGTSLTSEDLNAYASVRRDLQDYARLDPRVSMVTDNFGSAQISVAGQNNRYNSMTIDGVTTNDTFGLESNNLPTLKQPISIDAIESVQINVSNYDVTQTAYSGANINAVTKSGTNEFHGTVTYVYRDDDLVGDRYIPATDTYISPPPLEETTMGLTFGGPLIKDTLFFFLSYEEFATTRNGINVGPIGSPLQNVGITTATLDNLIALASRSCGPGVPTTCGMDIGNYDPPTGVELTSEDLMFKLDWNVNDNHRVSLRYNKVDQLEPFFRNNIAPTISGGVSNGGALSFSSHWDAEYKVFETYVGQWFADWSEDFSTELKLSYRDYDKGFNTNSQLPDVTINVRDAIPGFGGTRTIRFGTELSRHFNTLMTETVDGYFGANWYLGDHLLKFGVDYSDNDIFNAFQQNTKGSYTFDCLLTSQCARSFQAGIPLVYTATVPQAGRTLDDAAAIWGLQNTGFFLQDTWTVNYNLSVVFGVRADHVGVDNSPIQQLRESDGLSVRNPVIAGVGQFGRQTGGFGYDNTVTIDGNVLWQPRLGFNYTFDSERPMQLRGGVGLFQGAAANVWLSNPFTNTGEAVQTTGCGGSLPACGQVFSSDPNNQPIGGLSPPQLVVDIIHPDMEQPSVWKANLGFEAELPFWNIIASVEGLWTRTNTAIFYQHLNLGANTALGPDGRSLFWNANGLDRDCWGPTGSFTPTAPGCAGNPTSRARSNSAFGNVILARPTDKGGGESYTFALSRPMINDWSWSLAYTYTRSTEVAALTSSTANSQWNGRASFHPNEETESNSNYAIKNRIGGTLNWRHNFFGDYKTEIGLRYEGRSGRPYSWTFHGDANGDGIAFNDLLYIPSAPGSGEVVFRGGAAEEALFWSIINADPDLRGYIGGVVERNSARSPWVNQFDLRISQQLPGFWKDHKSVLVFDILNIGNLINKDWGHINDTFFPSLNRNVARIVGMDNGRYVYSLADGVSGFQHRSAAGESSWAVQVTFRYEF